MIAKLDREYAWWAAKNYATLDPELDGMRELLTEAMPPKAERHQHELSRQKTNNIHAGAVERNPAQH
jgi:hypothetical protein